MRIVGYEVGLECTGRKVKNATYRNIWIIENLSRAKRLGRSENSPRSQGMGNGDGGKILKARKFDLALDLVMRFILVLVPKASCVFFATWGCIQRDKNMKTKIKNAIILRLRWATISNQTCASMRCREIPTEGWVRGWEYTLTKIFRPTGKPWIEAHHNFVLWAGKIRYCSDVEEVKRAWNSTLAVTLRLTFSPQYFSETGQTKILIKIPHCTTRELIYEGWTHISSFQHWKAGRDFSQAKGKMKG